MPGQPRLNGVIVPGAGNIRARWAVVGERPGETEAWERTPFVGKAGKAQNAHLHRNGLLRTEGYFTNVCQDYIADNPAPTPADVERWRPTLLKELNRVRPKFIIAAGQYAARFFLGSNTYLEAAHGIPHQWSDGNGLSATVIPVYHPAAPFHQPDLLQFVVWDYARAAAAIKGKIDLTPPVDQFPNARYWVEELNPRIGGQNPIALDSEGTPGDVFSFQACQAIGCGQVFLGRTPPIRKGSTVVFHNGMYELLMAHSLGVDLLDPDLDLRFFDTMMAAYLLCIEPQSLKMLAKRHCGMEMKEYAEVVGEAGLKKQLAYLERVFEESWPDPEHRVERSNDGTTRLYRPQPVGRRAEAILVDYHSGKVDKEGNLCDPLKRWRKVDRELRRMVERRLGRMPIGTLRDVPLADAVYYAGRDPDACLRLFPKLNSALEAEGLTGLMNIKMAMLPCVATMRIEGILGERQAFEVLRDEMWDQMDVLSGKISKKYMRGKPFNPASAPQTRELMRRRGLQGEKKTKTGQISTSKKSIEHLRFEDESIEMLEQWRERQKTKDSFCESVLDNWPEDTPRCYIHTDIKITRVTSGRFSGSLLDDEPSAPLLAIPVRSSLGKSVRRCYIADPGYVLGEWDLDQAEMRVMADESGDETLVRLFNEGKLDIHTDTASKMFGVPYKNVDKMKHRYPAKRVGFGVITGIQGPGLLDQLRMAGVLNYSLDDCEHFIREWLRIYPGVQQYMLWCREECRRNGGVIKDRWGMPRYLPAILDQSREAKYDRLEAERQTHSHRIQGGAQGLLQVAMAAQWRRLRRYGELVRPILQIHDAVMYKVIDDPDIREEVNATIVDTMCNTTKLKVPVRTSSGFAYNWGDLKD